MLSCVFAAKKLKETQAFYCLWAGIFYTYCFDIFSILTDDHAWKKEGVFKSFIAYASFTTLDFPFELYLWLRYFVQRDGLTDSLMKRYVLLHNIAIVSLNMMWQARYLLQLSNMGILGPYAFGYLVLFTGWLQEEYVVMDFLYKMSKEKSK